MLPCFRPTASLLLTAARFHSAIRWATTHYGVSIRPGWRPGWGVKDVVAFLVTEFSNPYGYPTRDWS